MGCESESFVLLPPLCPWVDGVPHAEIEVGVVAVIGAFAFTFGLRFSPRRLERQNPPGGP